MFDRKCGIMMFPYMKFPDDTEVTHSKIQADGTVKVYIETPVEGGFKNLTCILPDYMIENHGYSDNELSRWTDYIKNNAHIIIEMAEKGGVMHATAV